MSLTSLTVQLSAADEFQLAAIFYLTISGSHRTLPLSNRKLSDFVKRIPFTFVMVACLIVAGVLAGSHAELLDRPTRRYFGGSLQTILDGELTRLFTSLFLTAGGWRFFASVLMLGFCVGWAELTRGTWRTVAVFFGVHLATMTILYFAFVLPLAKMEFAFAELLVDARDVGPSAGYYGCLGMALWSTSKNWKWRLMGIVFAVLIGRLVTSWIAIDQHPQHVIGDVAHLIALPLGLLVAATLFRSKHLENDADILD